MSVLKKILSWSKSCPAWQRDALRRLLQNGTLSTKDLSELTLICQSAHGLLPSETQAPANQPLSEEHLPPDVQGDQAVVLTTIESVQHVNAIVGNVAISRPMPDETPVIKVVLFVGVGI